MAMQSTFAGSSLRGARAAFGARAPMAPARGGLVIVAGYNNMVKLGGGKKWERQELTANGKPVRVPMHVKKGDVVQVGGGWCGAGCVGGVQGRWWLGGKAKRGVQQGCGVAAQLRGAGGVGVGGWHAALWPPSSRSRRSSSGGQSGGRRCRQGGGGARSHAPGAAPSPTAWPAGPSARGESLLPTLTPNEMKPLPDHRRRGQGHRW
jgi:hypothetical protein